MVGAGGQGRNIDPSGHVAQQALVAAAARTKVDVFAGPAFLNLNFDREY
jgi:hypothetical protein